MRPLIWQAIKPALAAQAAQAALAAKVALAALAAQATRANSTQRWMPATQRLPPEALVQVALAAQQVPAAPLSPWMQAYPWVSLPRLH
jgi:hypothetical protein